MPNIENNDNIKNNDNIENDYIFLRKEKCNEDYERQEIR